MELTQKAYKTKYAGWKNKTFHEAVRSTETVIDTFLITEKSYEFSCVSENLGYYAHNGV